MKNLLIRNVLLSCLFASASAMACTTKEQALNTMLKLNAVAAEYQLKGASDEPDSAEWEQRRIALITAMVPYADMIAKDRYADACNGYREVAEEFEIELANIKSMTVKDYDKYDKKYPSKNPCSTLSLVTRINELGSEYSQQAYGSPVRKRLDFANAKYSYLYATDINAVCGFLQEMEASLKGLPSVPDRSGGKVSRRTESQ